MDPLRQPGSRRHLEERMIAAILTTLGLRVLAWWVPAADGTGHLVVQVADRPAVTMLTAIHPVSCDLAEDPSGTLWLVTLPVTGELSRYRSVDLGATWELSEP